MGIIDRLRGRGGPRVALLGLDGVPYSLLADNPGVFENVLAIGEAGGGGAVESTLPVDESACWPAMMAGVNPGKTGVYGFTDREVGSYETYVPMGNDVQADRLWNRVAAADREATVLNVPVTFPPERDPQRTVAGSHATDVASAAYPDELRDYLVANDYRLEADAAAGHENTETFLADATEMLETRFEAFSHYVEADDWDLFVGVFTTPDRVNHFLYGDYERGGEHREAFLDFYRELDRYVGELHALLADDVTTVVASDHGFTALDYEVHCNEWLADRDWLTYDREDHEDLNDIAPGRFYLNLADREPRGTVPPEEYESARADLRAAVESMTDPEGNQVVDRVVPSEEAFQGPHDDLAPDLVAVPNPGYELQGRFGTPGEVFSTGARSGMHTLDDAALLVDEPGVSVSGDVNLYDVAPTVLDLLDIDYESADFDGTSLA
jgi:predicted AlkP superfamily phosphohydrolase/phosphomutase